MTIISADCFSSLDFIKVKSPFPNKYPSPYHVPDEVPYSELDEVAIAFVKGLPSPLLEFIGEPIPSKHTSNGEFESFTEYLIEPIFDTGLYLVRQYTFYQ